MKATHNFRKGSRSVFTAAIVTALSLTLCAVGYSFNASSPASPNRFQRTVQRTGGETSSKADEWTFTASGIKRLSIKNASGNIVLRNSNNGELYIKAVRSGDSPEEIDKVSVDVDRLGDSVAGKVKYGTDFSTVGVDFVIDAPPGLSIQLQSASGSIGVEQYSGELDLRTGSGQITLKEVDGQVHTNTGSGDIQAYYWRPLARTSNPMTLSELQAKWSSPYARNELGGNVGTGSRKKLREYASQTFASGSGSITLYFAQQVEADVFAESLSGGFKSEFEASSAVSNNKRLITRINGGGPVLVLNTSSGQVSLKRL